MRQASMGLSSRANSTAAMGMGNLASNFESSQVTIKTIAACAIQ
jgi:hypothetical protein